MRSGGGRPVSRGVLGGANTAVPYWVADGSSCFYHRMHVLFWSFRRDLASGPQYEIAVSSGAVNSLEASLRDQSGSPLKKNASRINISHQTDAFTDHLSCESQVDLVIQFQDVRARFSHHMQDFGCISAYMEQGETTGIREGLELGKETPLIGESPVSICLRRYYIR